MRRTAKAARALLEVDLRPFLTPARAGAVCKEARASAERLRTACERDGAFFAVGHDEAAVSAGHRAAWELFGLPEAQKTGKSTVQNDGFVRGYLGLGAESGNADLLEVKEGFSYGFEWPADEPPTNSLQGPNVWPEGAPREPLQALFGAMVAGSEAVVRGLSLALGTDLERYCAGGDTISLMRLFHYWPYAHAGADAPEARIGSSPHTDWGYLTAIAQDDVGGLEVYADGRWHGVQPRTDALVFNCGDYLSLLSGGRLRSPIHRVTTADRERLSCVFFYYPSFESQIPQLSPVDGSAEHAGDADRAAFKFNTLCSQTDILDRPFGEYLDAKWASVQSG